MSFALLGAAEGVQTTLDKWDNKRQKLADSFERFKRDNPEATYDDFQEWIENNSSGVPDFWLKGALPDDDKLRELGEKNARATELKRKQERIGELQQTAQLRSFFEQGMNDIILEGVTDKDKASKLFAERYGVGPDDKDFGSLLETDNWDRRVNGTFNKYVMDNDRLITSIVDDYDTRLREFPTLDDFQRNGVPMSRAAYDAAKARQEQRLSLKRKNEEATLNQKISGLATSPFVRATILSPSFDETELREYAKDLLSPYTDRQNLDGAVDEFMQTAGKYASLEREKVTAQTQEQAKKDIAKRLLDEDKKAGAAFDALQGGKGKYSGPSGELLTTVLSTHVVPAEAYSAIHEFLADKRNTRNSSLQDNIKRLKNHLAEKGVEVIPNDELGAYVQKQAGMNAPVPQTVQEFRSEIGKELDENRKFEERQSQKLRAALEKPGLKPEQKQAAVQEYIEDLSNFYTHLGQLSEKYQQSLTDPRRQSGPGWRNKEQLQDIQTEIQDRQEQLKQKFERAQQLLGTGRPAPGGEPAARSGRGQYDDMINRAASASGMPQGLLHAQIAQESAYKPNAVSHAGARGIAQFMPATGAAYGLKTEEDFFNPQKSIDAMGRHMRDLLAKYNGDIKFALAAYNTGETNLNRAIEKASKRLGVAPSSVPYEEAARHLASETQNYVPTILKRAGQG